MFLAVSKYMCVRASVTCVRKRVKKKVSLKRSLLNIVKKTLGDMLYLGLNFRSMKPQWLVLVDGTGLVSFNPMKPTGKFHFKKIYGVLCLHKPNVEV
jgi:hypothetical protein